MQPLTIEILPSHLFSWTGINGPTRRFTEMPRVKDYLNITSERAVQVKQLPIIIGRAHNDRDPANIMIHWLSRNVSLAHAQIYDDTGVIKILDLKSQYGTLLQRDNKPIPLIPNQGIPLRDNDLLILGYLSKKEPVQLRIYFGKKSLRHRIFSRIKRMFH